MDDGELIAQAAEGDRAAFVTLVERHRAMVYRVAFQYAGNHYDADDIAQDVFIKVHRSLQTFRRDALFTSWLYRVTMNACIDHGRRRSPTTSIDAARAEERPFEVMAEEPGPDQRAFAGEVRRAVEHAVDDLPPQQRLVFAMRHFEGMKLCDIAEALGVAEGTVKRQLHSAVHRLRHALAHVRVTARAPRTRQQPGVANS
jgi:RNA polymerase sigma-70 factor (ECF subfamily)